MQRVTECLILSERSHYIFAPQGFVTKCFLIFIVNEVKKFAANIFFKLVNESRTEIRAKKLVTYRDLCNKKGGIHILKSSEVLKQLKVSAVSSSTGIVEFRDKCFVLDLKLLFTIMNCFSERFTPKFFTMKLVCFIGFPKSSYLVLFIFPLHDFDKILMFVCFNKFYS